MGKNWKKIGPIGQKWSKKNTTLRPAIFLDRDGTLIRHRSLVLKKEHMRPFVTVAPLAQLKKAGFLLIGITNQPPIEKGEIPVAIAEMLNETLQKNLKKYGVALDAIYTCPHRHATGCACKKPQLGMLKAAQKDFRIDMSHSWLLGDTHTDMETGKRAKLKTILLATGSTTKDKQYFSTQGTYTVRNLSRATAQIEQFFDRHK